VFQSMILCGKFSLLIDKISELVLEEKWDGSPVNCPSNIRRFAAHLILFFIRRNELEIIGLSERDEKLPFNPKWRQILISYISLLIETSQHSLIARYVSILQEEDQIQLYSEFLLKIEREPKEVHQKAISLAVEMKLPIQKIIQVVSARLRESATTFSRSVSTTLTDEDVKKIQSLKWFIFLPEHGALGLLAANALTREFLLNKRFLAARKIYCDPLFSHQRVKEIARHFGISSESTPNPQNLLLHNSMHEYGQLEELLECFESFSIWEKLSAIPLADINTFPSTPTTQKLKTDEYARKNAASYRLQKEKEREDQGLATAEAILKCLGLSWLVELGENNLHEEELMKIRKKYIPELCFMLYIIYSKTNHHDKCLEIGNLISENELRRYFSQEELRKILQDVRQSALHLLQNGVKPTNIPQ